MYSITSNTDTSTDIKAIAIRSMQIMASGSLDEFEEIIHPDCVNHEAKDEPPEARGRGPRAIYATALWLREAFHDLAFEVHAVVAEGDLVVVHNTMTGRHEGTFVGFDADAEVSEAFPPTHKSFASTQTHWLRIADGKLIEHWANRDDLATAMQLGWAPPTPLYLLRMALAKRRARRRYSASVAPVGAAHA